MASLLHISVVLFTTFSTAQFLHTAQLPPGSSFPVPGEDASYDYVVVGGGTAGLPLATRLAQDGRYTVALIEAGSFYELDNGNRSVIPAYDFHSAGFGSMAGVNPLIDWEFQTTQQAGADNVTWHYPQGKCLSGTSARNYMVYQRPTVGTMQKWSDSVGDQSWTWENVLPYYKRSSTFTPPNISLRSPSNATPLYDASVFGDGPIHVSYAHYASPVAGWALKAWDEIGDSTRTNGMQSGELLGHQYIPTILEPKQQERSPSQEYLKVALKNTQLNVYTNSFVKRVLFDGSKTATGVTVETEGMPYTVTANKEVILSAGAFQSPQLLMVSGIGPEKTLSKYDIAVIQDLPGVGQNMQDNPFFAITFAVDIDTSSVYTNNPSRMAEAIAAYNSNRTGFLTSSMADVISFQRLVDIPDLNISTQAKQDLASVPDDWPDTMFWLLAAWVGPSLGSLPPTSTRNYAAIVGSLTAPLSRGYVTINSPDMADPPIINPNLMTNPTDQELAVATMRRMRHFINTTAIQTIILGPEAYPGPNVTSYDDLLHAIHQQNVPFGHASVTSKMGMANDSMAVVDSKARVFGVNHLRVVDVSAMPFLPPGQPQATVYMLAEKIADEILHGDSEAGRENEYERPSAQLHDEL